MARIVSFGDSWAYGAELKNPEIENYSYLLSKRTSIPYYNYGANANSLQFITTEIFQKYTPQTDDFILVCVPPDIRSLGERLDGSFMSVFTTIPEEQTPTLEKKQFYHFIDVISQLKSWSPYHQLLNLFSIQSYFKSLNIPYLFFTNFGYIDFTFNFQGKIDKNHLLEKSLTTLLGGNDSNICPSRFSVDGPTPDIFTGKYFKGNNTHPNLEGHKIIADTIYNHKMFQQWLMSTTNTES